MEFIKKILFRSKIAKTKGEIFRILEELKPFFDRSLPSFQGSKMSQVEKGLLKEIHELLKQLANYSSSTLFDLVIQGEMSERAREMVSTLSARVFESLGNQGEKLLARAFFQPTYQNHPALAPFIRPFLQFGLHRLQSLLPRIFRYHEKCLLLRSKVIENFARVITKTDLAPILELLRETRPEEALEIYFALSKDISPQHLKHYKTDVLAFLDVPSTAPLGAYLTGYIGGLKTLQERALDGAPILRLAMVNAISLFSRKEKLLTEYHRIFKEDPSLLKPFFEGARDQSLFTPRGNDAFVLSMLKGEEVDDLKEGVESILEYKPEFKRYLWEALQVLPEMSTVAGLAVLQILRDIKDPLVVPLMVQVYSNVPDLQQTIVQVVGQLQDGERLVDILNHFKRRTRQRLVSETIDRLLEKKRKERYNS